MKILYGRQVRTFKEAVDLAFREAGADDMSLSSVLKPKRILSLRFEAGIEAIPPEMESGGASAFRSLATIPGALHTSQHDETKTTPEVLLSLRIPVQSMQSSSGNEQQI